VRTKLHELQRLALAGELPKENVDRVAALTEQKLSELEQAIQLRRDRGLDAALAIVRADQGERVMDEIRAEVGQMRANEEKEFAAASRRAEWAVTLRTQTFSAMCVVNLAFLFWAFRKVAGEVRRRESAVFETNQQKELLATTLTSIGDAVIATDSDGRVIFLNAEAEALTGWKSSEAAGHLLPEVFHIVNERTRQPVENPVEKVLRVGAVVGLANHTVLLAKDGGEIPIDDSAAPIRQPDGPLFGVILVFRDVTTQRKAQDAAARLAAIVEHSGDAMFTKDLDGVVRTWNASAERLFGYRAEEIVGRPVTVLVPPDRLHEDDEILARIRAGQPVERLETIRISKCGRRIPVAVSVSPLKNEDGEVIGASKIIHDITDLIAAREELVREKELLATTLASIGDAVIVTDAAGRITFINGEAERLTKWSNADATAQPLPAVFRIINEQTRQPVENPVEKVLRLDGIAGLANHTVLIARDGTETPIDDSAAPIRTLGGPLFGAVFVFRDFTERKRVEEEVRQLNAELKQKLEEMTTLQKILPVGVWIGNRDCSEIRGNPAGYQIFGLPENINASATTKNPELPSGLRIRVNGVEVPPGDLPMQRVARTGRPWNNFEHDITFPDGTTKVVYGSVAPLFDEKGEVRQVIAAYTDFTERKRAEEALRESEERYRATFENAGIGIAHVGLDGRWLRFNDAVCAITGYSREELQQKTFADITHPDDVEADWRQARQVLASEISTYSTEKRYIRKDGSLVWVCLTVTLMRESSGAPSNFISLIEEIQKRKQAEEALRESEERLAGLINSAMDAVIAVDSRQRIVLFNPAAEKMFGCAASDALGNSLDRFIPERHRDAHRGHVENFAQTGVTTRRMGALGALSGVRSNGEEFPIEAAISQLEIRGRKLFTVILRDITERKKAEEQQSRLAAIIESSRDAIISKSLEGIVTSWNPGAEGLFGYSASEMVGQPVRRIIPDELLPEEDAILSRLRAGQSAEHYETVRITKSGSRLPVSITSSPIKDSTGKTIGASKIIRDITEQKRTNENLREAQRKVLLHAADLEATVAERTSKLQEMVNELQHVSYAIAHDMRAPLRAMHTFASLLSQEAETAVTPEQRRDYGRRIIAAASRLDRLIQDALHYTKVAQQEMPLGPVDLSKLMRELVETYPNLHADKADILIENELPVVLGNDSLLTQCFSNLLGNAVKFVKPCVKPEVRLRAEIRDGMVKIWVKDKGIGIPKNAQARLFQMFQKLDNEYEGTGVGLAIVRKVVERMGGKVGAESELGQGSCFWVELPLANGGNRERMANS
jgi:PAS domain S-box-containing protein